MLRRRSDADTVIRPSRSRVRQKVVPLPARVSLIGEICVITETTDLQAIANHERLYHRLIRLHVASPLSPIFMLGGAPEAHEVLSKMSRIGVLYFAHGLLPRDISDQG